MTAPGIAALLVAAHGAQVALELATARRNAWAIALEDADTPALIQSAASKCVLWRTVAAYILTHHAGPVQ